MVNSKSLAQCGERPIIKECLIRLGGDLDKYEVAAPNLSVTLFLGGSTRTEGLYDVARLAAIFW
ncbi:hypothetical protein [Vibrio sp. Hep-1b-8]|uniref:hypothetical protein n=1 Tax=Vibrio sp. Hep-1b-8 TaxID=2144187 RepID=UPI001F0E0A1F|nr:hypothetical protein [Vibrio sp. Hep-1b-8]